MRSEGEVYVIEMEKKRKERDKIEGQAISPGVRR
jgi:hypothetical protein